MKDYDMLATLYPTKFLNYIISRSKALSSTWGLEYPDLIQDGLLKLIEVYSKYNKVDDPFVMAALVNFYNDSWNEQVTAAQYISLDELKKKLLKEEEQREKKIREEEEENLKETGEKE